MYRVKNISLLGLCLWLISIGQSQAVETDNLRDPTRPSSSTTIGSAPQHKNAGTELILNSVVKHSNDAYAVFNNKLYRLGDRISEAQIQQITHHSVTLSDGRTFKVYQAIIER